MYKARKKSRGAQTGNQNAQKQCSQNDDIEKGPNRTAAIIAKELGIGLKTVERAEKFHDGVDALRGVSKKVAGRTNHPPGCCAVCTYVLILST